MKLRLSAHIEGTPIEAGMDIELPPRLANHIEMAGTILGAFRNTVTRMEEELHERFGNLSTDR